MRDSTDYAASPRPNRPGMLLRVAVRFLAVVCLATAGGVAFTYVVPVLAEYQQVLEEEAALHERREALRREVARARNELHWLRYDPAFYEIHARDRLNLQRPDEIVVRFPDQPGGED